MSVCVNGSECSVVSFLHSVDELSECSSDALSVWLCSEGRYELLTLLLLESIERPRSASLLINELRDEEAEGGGGEWSGRR